MKTKTNPFVLFFAALFILSSVVLSVLAWQEQKNNMETVKKSEFGSVLLKIKSLEMHLSPVVADLAFIGNLHSLRDFLDSGTEQNKKNLQAEFLLAVFMKQYYDQIRFIDASGMEVVRINDNSGQPEIVPEIRLQNKKNRYYFRDTMDLNRGQFYASPFDLNVENGKVEYPVKPMIRIGMPVFDSSGKKRGMVIINYLGDLLLKDFSKNTLIHNMVIFSEENIWLINPEGFWLKGPDPGKEWSFMYNDKKNISFRDEYPNEWKIVLSTENGQIKNKNGLFTYATVFPFTRHLSGQNDNTELTTPDSYRWKVVSYIPASVLKKDTMKLLWKYAVIFIFINFLSLIGNLALFRGISRVWDAEDKIRMMLQKRSDFQALLLKIYQSKYSDIKSGLKEVINTAYGFLQVDYISIWIMNKENTRITCMDIPVSSEIYPYTDMSVDFDSFPEYFNEVLKGDQIVADNALEHHATKEFKKNYLIPHNVTSMLDSPIWNHGKIVGVFALALRGTKRSWTKEEKSFATQTASTIAALIETNDRIEAERAMKDAVMEAEAANRTKSEFLANMSHEIRTPLNAILGFSEVLMEQTVNKQHIEYLKSINSSGKTLLALINDILDLSKIESGKIEIVNLPVNVYKVIVDMKRIFSQKTEEKKLKFIIEANPEIPEFLLLDETRLRQILFNVIGNAVKFTDKGFIKINLDTVTSSESTDTVSLIIKVEDTGIGIPQDKREKVFDPFEQTGKGSLAKYGGTGLGLAIVRKLLTLMNGKVVIPEKNTPGTIIEISFFKVIIVMPGSERSILDG